MRRIWNVFHQVHVQVRTYVNFYDIYFVTSFLLLVLFFSVSIMHATGAIIQLDLNLKHTCVLQLFLSILTAQEFHMPCTHIDAGSLPHSHARTLQ